MPVARPRTVSLPPDEMIKLGEEMVAWVKENKPPHLSAWYTIEKGYTYKEWDTFHVKPEFIGYYEQAKMLVAMQYLDGTIPPALAQRWQRIYFKDVADKEDKDHKDKLTRELEHDKQKMAYEASLKAQLTESVHATINEQLAAMMSQIKRSQAVDAQVVQSVDLKIDETISSAESKS